MKIEWNDLQVETVIKALEAVDKRSNDPMYGNLVGRIEHQDAEGYEMPIVVLEEFEMFTVVEALMEVVDDRDPYMRQGDIVDEDVVLMEDLINEISRKYGVSL